MEICQKSILDLLSNTKGKFMYFDIETDWEEQNLLCFAFSFDGLEIYSIPVLDYEYKWAYINLPQVMRALAIAIKDNTVVAHNGAAFDFFVLAHKYRIPINKTYDTMLAMHRCFPDVERSLGHCLIGDSIIDTVSGRFKIKDLVGKESFYVWSWKDNNPFPSKVKRVFKTRENAKLVKVNCWRKMNDGVAYTERFSITCTPEHLFLVDDVWIKAKDLSTGTSLTKVRISYGKSYEARDRITYVKDGKDIRERTHTYIWKCLNGVIEPNYDIHHKDEDMWNNEPTNLEKLNSIAHKSLHATKVANKSKNSYFDYSKKQWIPFNDLELKSLYESGMSKKEIAQQYKVDIKKINNALKRTGTKFRTWKEIQDNKYKREKNCAVISVEALENAEDVYCMEVEDTECFSTNGVIVHNCTSFWTDERFHKDTDSRAYATREHMMQKLQYCAKDVYTMYLIHQSIDFYAKTVPGLSESIDTAMDCIKPYLITSLQGIKYSEEVRKKVLNDNDIILNKYLTLINYLVGEDTLNKIKTKASKSVLPLSNKQCVKYFHDELGYAVVGRSSVSGEPSLAKQNLFKLQLKHDNPVITLISVFRAVAKESSMLKFTPWKDDNNNVINYKTYETSIA
jgi:hypothetical protein